MFKSLQLRRTNRANAVLLALVGSLVASPAFAQSSGFDGSSIVAKIVEYGAIGVTILAAFALAKWGMRAIGLVK